MSLSRRAIAGLAVAGLAAGGLVGAGTGPLLQAASPDSLAVFDRESTPADELAPGVVTYGPFSASRLLTEFDDVRVFAVRADQNLRTGLDDLGPLICVSAAAPGMEFVPTSCVPEEVFREQGMRGVLRGLAPAGSVGGYRDVERVLAVEWGPRGGPRIVDMTDSAVVALDDLFTDDELALGADIPLVASMRSSAAAEWATDEINALTELPAAIAGPVSYGESGYDGLGITELFASLHPPEGDEEAHVCLSVRVEGEFVAWQCNPLETVRIRGVRVVVEHDGGQTAFRVGPNNEGISVEQTS